MIPFEYQAKSIKLKISEHAEMFHKMGKIPRQRRGTKHILGIDIYCSIVRLLSQLCYKTIPNPLGYENNGNNKILIVHCNVTFSPAARSIAKRRTYSRIPLDRPSIFDCKMAVKEEWLLKRTLYSIRLMVHNFTVKWP